MAIRVAIKAAQTFGLLAINCSSQVGIGEKITK